MDGERIPKSPGGRRFTPRGRQDTRQDGLEPSAKGVLESVKGLEMKSLLVITQDPDVAALSETLAASGYEVILRDTARGGAGLLDPSQIGAVVADGEVPGIEALFQEKRREPIPWILLGDSAAAGACMEWAYDRCSKPVEPDGLLRAVERAVRYGDALADNRRLGKCNAQFERTLEKVLHHKMNSYQNGLYDLIQIISNLIALRDPYTAGHQRRVGNLAAALGRQMGRTPFQQNGLYVMGSLHDIGKHIIPASILCKPSPLRSFEYEIIKTHVACGYDILKKAQFPWPVADIIYQHHERLDGSGYPNGLKGDQIEPDARIIMVADVMEAMISCRPYRPALAVEDAIRQLKNGRAIQFDAQVTDACVRLFLEEGYQQMDEYRQFSGTGDAWERKSSLL